MTAQRHLSWMAGAALAVVGVVTLGDGTGVAPAHAGAKIIFDTVLGLAAFVGGLLFYARFRASSELADAAFTYGFLLTGTGALILAFSRSLVGEHAATVVTTAVALRAVGAVVVALAAVDVPRGRPEANAAIRALVVLVPTAFVVALVVVLVSGDIHRTFAAEQTRTLILRSQHVPWVTAMVHAFVAAALAVAAYASRLKARTEGDGFAHRLGVGLAILAVGRLYLVLFPGAPAPRIHLWDLCQAAAYAVILWALASWLVAHWRAMAVSSAIEEREKVARTLHDGIAQDLALLSAQSSWLSKRSSDSEDLAFVALVAQHALTESRRTISSLRGLSGRDNGRNDRVAAPSDITLDSPAGSLAQHELH